jgi:hypothetical protein
MNAKIRISCVCGQIIEGQCDVIERKLTAICPNCGPLEDGSVDLNFSIGDALVGYAENALSSGDTNFAILLSGMAVDCYLSRLYYKWRDIEELWQPNYKPEVSRTKIQEELVKIRDFLEKVKKVENLLFPKGTQKFLELHPELKQEIKQGFPSLNSDTFALSIRNQVMRKRNNIVHVSQRKYSHDDAIKTINQAKLFIKVFATMDKEKT